MGNNKEPEMSQCYQFQSVSSSKEDTPASLCFLGGSDVGVDVGMGGVFAHGWDWGCDWEAESGVDVKVGVD